MKYFQNKYRIPSARAEWWDYGNQGAYFVTICAQSRIPYFGEVTEKRFIPNQIGKIAETIWHQIPDYFPNVKLGAFAVMPDHLHGIIIIENKDESTTKNNLKQITSEEEEFHTLGVSLELKTLCYL